MGNDLIVMDNSIITSAYNLTLNEQRLIYCALKQIPKGEPIDPKMPFFITRDDFIELGVNPDTVAREIRHATSELMKKTVLVRTNTGILQFHWLSEVLRYDKNAEQRLKEKYPNPSDYNKYINALRAYNLLDALPFHKDNDNIVARVVFHEKIVPLLSDLKASFTQFTLSEVSEFSSIYAFRIYQLMMQYKSTGYVRIDLDDLRYMLVLLEKYPLVADLRRWVIEVAVNEINAKSPYFVKYELIKRGRKFVALELKFSLKTKAIESIIDPKTVDMLDGLTDLERQVIQERIDETIKRAESKGEIVSDFYRQNITKKAIAERWGLDVLAKKQKQVTEAEQAATIKSDWDKVPDGTKYRHEDGTTWIKEDGGFFHCIDTNRTAPPSQAPEILTSGKFVLINNKSNEMDFKQPEPEHDEMAKYKAKIDAKLVEIQTMPNGQLFQASDRTVYEKRGDVFYNITHTDGTRPRSLLDAARCWSVDSWKPIDKMPEPSTPSRIFKHYATEQDILADRAKGLNPMDFLTDDERKEVNEIIEEYQENKDPEIYEFIVNILGIQLEEPKKSSLMARLKRQN